jgi:hypothetical protein
MKLYEIDQKIAEIFDAMTVDEETGEATLDEEALDELQEQRLEKLEGAALYVKDLEAMARAIREEEKALAKRRQSMEAKAGRIREWIAYHLDDEKLETARVRVSVRKGTSSVKVDDPYSVRHWFCEAIIKGGWDTLSESEKAEYAHVRGLLDERPSPPVYSKAGIKKLLDEGYEIYGVHIEAGKPSLLIK